jgi:hypothetical protein
MAFEREAFVCAVSIMNDYLGHLDFNTLDAIARSRARRGLRFPRFSANREIGVSIAVTSGAAKVVGAYRSNDRSGLPERHLHYTRSKCKHIISPLCLDDAVPDHTPVF